MKIRFRVSKITPNKTGQFVSIWEKDENNKNKAFEYEYFPDFLVITYIDNNNLGQFVFPKSILAEKNIVKTSINKGKMAFRVYPPWNITSNKQSILTQKWQLDYFIDLKTFNKFI